LLENRTGVAKFLGSNHGVSVFIMSAQTASSEHSSYDQADDQITTALERLNLAIDALEAALSIKVREGKTVSVLERELEVLLGDRSKLALELNQVKAKASRLDAAGAKVSEHLDKVTANLRSILTNIK